MRSLLRQRRYGKYDTRI
ncbi:Fluconazole resistance protein 1, partial [Fusarium oxysporum f. sp. albedinis]